jgi:hypothetical protein
VLKEDEDANREVVVGRVMAPARFVAVRFDFPNGFQHAAASCELFSLRYVLVDVSPIADQIIERSNGFGQGIRNRAAVNQMAMLAHDIFEIARFGKIVQLRDGMLVLDLFNLRHEFVFRWAIARFSESPFPQLQSLGDLSQSVVADRNSCFDPLDSSLSDSGLVGQRQLLPSENRP